MTCEDCGAELPARGGRGRPRKRCDGCSRVKKNASRRQATPAQAKQARSRQQPVQRSSARSEGVVGATQAELDELPEHLARSATAAAALELARSIDLGQYSFRFQAGLVKELRDCMTELKAQAPAKERDSVDDLAARRAARRGSVSAS